MIFKIQWIYGVFILLSMTTWGESLTLKQAVEIGLKNNFDIRLSRNSNQIAQNNKKLGIGGFLPKLSGNAGVQNNGVDSSLTFPWGHESDSKSTVFNASVDLSWTLFDGFRMFYTRNLTQQTARLSDLRTRESIENAVLSLMRAYFHTVTQQALLSTVERQVAISRERLERARVRRDLGQATKAEWIKAQVDINSDQSELESRRLAYIAARNSLTLSLGRSVSDSVQSFADTSLPELSNDLTSWVSRAQSNNLRLGLLDRQSRLGALKISVARSARWPTLVANGSYNWLFSDIDMGFAQNTRRATNASLGLRATMPLFDGFSTKTNILNQQTEAASAVLTRDQYQRQLEALVHYQYQAVSNSIKQIKYDKQTVTLATTHLQLMQESYNLGRATSLEFREAQLTLLQAQTRKFLALFSARLALLELQRLAGELKVE